MKYVHVMIDLETMGNTPDAAIISIGACAWVAGHEDDTFQQDVTLESSMDGGGKVDASTIRWWLQQSDAARKTVSDPEDTLPLKQALRHFGQWLDDVRASAGAPEDTTLCLWGNGVASDNVWLRGAYERLGMPPPWNFRENRCYRTLRALMPHIKGGPPVGISHRAVDDAVFQMEHLKRMLAALPQENQCNT